MSIVINGSGDYLDTITEANLPDVRTSAAMGWSLRQGTGNSIEHPLWLDRGTRQVGIGHTATGINLITDADTNGVEIIQIPEGHWAFWGWTAVSGFVTAWASPFGSDEVGTITLAGTTSSLSADDFRIGQRSATAWHEGLVSNVMLYDTEISPQLTREEFVRQKRQIVPVRFSGMRGWWRLRHATEAGVDASPVSSNDLTINGTIETGPDPAIPWQYQPAIQYRAATGGAPPGGLSIPIAAHHYRQIQGVA